MTIAKAIEYLRILKNYSNVKIDLDLAGAIDLGVEAMCRIDRQRHGEVPIHQPPLPGETVV